MKKRAAAFTRNMKLESLLKEVNMSLWMLEKECLKKQPPSNFPLILIMGPLRSGTTLFMQWLANSGIVAYPSNMLSRFYHAPIIGAKLQLLLTDPRYNFRDELGEFAQQVAYQSENGKTKGVLAPNEFWYFWRRFLSQPERDVWTNEELQHSMDTQTMLAELAGLMEVFQKPFAAKGMLFNYNIPFLDSILDKAIFVQIRRDPVANIASVLEARKRQFDNEKTWYSFKIPEYEQLKHLDPVSQSAGQIYFINKAISQGMSTVDESRKLIVDYEDFCRNPTLYYDALVKKISNNGYSINSCYQAKIQFHFNKDIVNSKQISKVYRQFEEKELCR